MSSESASSTSQHSQHASLFPPTLWSVVLGAKSEDPAEAQEAIRTLCAIYRDPIVAWLKQRGYIQDHEDLAHGFVEFLSERNRFLLFERREAKFRSFLLKCLRGFLKDLRQKAAAGIRDPGTEPLSLDHPDFREVGVDEKHTINFDREFAVSTHKQVMFSLVGYYSGHGQCERLRKLRSYLFGQDGKIAYAQLAAELDMSPGSVKKAVFDLRERYYDGFRNEVAQTVSPEEADEEMRYLFTLLAETEIADDP